MRQRRRTTGSGPAKTFFFGCNALGDTLCTTPILAAYRRRHPDTFITYIVQNAGYCRVLDGNPDVDLVLYNEHLWMHGVDGVTTQWLHSLPLALDGPALLHHFDMNGVCSRAESFHDHIARGFSRLLDIPIDSVRPIVRVTAEERRIARALVPRPYVILSTHSNANPVRPDGSLEKDWGLDNWRQLARHLRTERRLEVVTVGAERDAPIPIEGTRPLYGLPIKIVAALLEAATCVVTLENGLAHLAAGVDAATVELYSPIVPLAWAAPEASTRVRVLYRDPRLITVPEVIDAFDAVSQAPRRAQTARPATMGRRL